MEVIKKYQEIFSKAVKDNLFHEDPQNLYDPINYLVANGGKRLRPIITLMSCQFFNGDINKAIRPALAMEYFHNFTLIHDDIMDAGTMRRGKPAVHVEYGLNQAILSGDVLLIKSYQYFDELSDNLYKKVVTRFTNSANILCDGQQMDMNFEVRMDVTLDEYLKMIYYKTGALSASSFEIGALIGGASDEDAKTMYDFGKYLGIAFQLRDDLLDVYGSRKSFGKKRAGDILENKKTVLYIKARDKANKEDLDELNYWYSMRTENIDKIYGVEKIFNKLNVKDDVKELIQEYTNKALACLDKVNGNPEIKKELVEFAHTLTGRKA